MTAIGRSGPAGGQGEGGPIQIVIFGASGDLTARKLVPALVNLAQRGQPVEGFSLFGVARRPKTDEQFRNELREAHVRAGSRRPGGLRSADPLRPRAMWRNGRICVPCPCDSRRRPPAKPVVASSIFPCGRSSSCPRCENLAQAGLLARADAEPWAPRGRGEALRTRSRIGPGHQPVPPPAPRRGPDLPHRSLSGQGDGAEPLRLPLQQRHLRALVEPQPCGAGPDHRGRGNGHGEGAGGVLRFRPGPCGTWCRTTCCRSWPWWPWSPPPPWTRRPCAARRSTSSTVSSSAVRPSGPAMPLVLPGRAT